MGLFDWFYYGKAGKHDYSEMDMPASRLALFFMVLRDHAFDLIKANALQLVCWLPFLLWTFANVGAILMMDVQGLLAGENGAQQLTQTVISHLMMWMIGVIPCVAITGPSSAGAAYVMRNWARDQHAFLFSDFWDAWKRNWKQALGVSAITGCVPVLAYVGVLFYGQLAAQSAVMFLLMLVVIAATILWVLMLPLLYAMLIGYELRFRDLLKNALLMAIAAFPKLLFTRVVTFVPVALILLGLYAGYGPLVIIIVGYYLLLGFALSKLVYASVANSVFDQYLNPRIEGAMVNAGLRPRQEEEIEDDDDECL